jgi:eukaryotic-like serine/threonine-protein kinase
MTDGSARLTSALADRYQIERKLGAGGMATVYLAHDIKHDREVAIKVLKPELGAMLGAERFLAEIRVTANLRHPHILPLYDSGDADGNLFYVMPLVEGESLRDRLDREKQLPVDTALQIAREIADALSYAHTRGVIHRDIKPENILLESGHAVVADFGIAKAVRAAGGESLTQTGMSLGTPAYMSPEQAAGEQDLDGRSDLYALACVLYEMLAGQPPFTGATAEALVRQHMVVDAPPVTNYRPAVPALVAAALQRALAKAPADRFNPVAQFSDALRAGEGLPATVTTVAPKRDARRVPVAPGELKVRAVVRGGLGVALLAVVIFLVTRGRTASPSGTTSVLDRSVAVLPLANLSGDKADDYFGVGLAEEMTRALTKAGVRVIGRVSAGALQAKGFDERAIARELGVGSLLTGSVQRAGEQIRIQMSLLAASDGSVRWTEKYDRPLTNVFAVQDEIAHSVAGKLLGSLGGSPVTGPARNETNDPEAHALYLQGQVLFNRRTTQALQQSIGLLRQATERDSSYGRAWGLLAMAYSVLPAYKAQHTDSARTMAVAAASRAIRIDSTIAESYTAMAYVALARGENRASDSLFRRSLTLDSTVATTWGWYGLLAMHLGDYPVANRRSARARELEPASSIVQTWEAQADLAGRRYAAADSVAGLVIARDSTFALGWVTKANALINLGRGKEAIAILERRVADLPASQPSETQALLAYAYARAGQTQQAREVLAAMQRSNSGRYPAIGSIAATLDALDNRDAAVAVLGDAFADHDLWLVIFSHTERYDRLRKDARGAAMFARSEAR